MKKVAVFGKPGSGKSTFSKKLAIKSGIQYHPLDSIEYKENGERASMKDYNDKHQLLIEKQQWVIDGLGPMKSFWERIKAADTVIYIDLPYSKSYWWVTKRLLLSPFKKPVGWPDGSSILKGTVASLKYLRLSLQFWNEEFFNKLENKSEGKQLYRIKTVKQLNDLAWGILK